MTTIAISTATAMIGGETVNAVNARELWQYLENKREFSSWIKDRIENYGFQDGVDFCLINLSSKTGSGGHNRKDYIISLDMAKELAMVENNAKGRAARQYFIEVEKRSRTMDPLALAKAIANEAMARALDLAADNGRLKVRNRYLSHFEPMGSPGELADNGKPKTMYRRGCFCTANGKSYAGLLRRLDFQPDMFGSEQKAIEG